eukprot:2894657-Rhodomonas_salina.6
MLYARSDLSRPDIDLEPEQHRSRVFTETSILCALPGRSLHSTRNAPPRENADHAVESSSDRQRRHATAPCKGSSARNQTASAASAAKLGGRVEKRAKTAAWERALGVAETERAAGAALRAVGFRRRCSACGARNGSGANSAGRNAGCEKRVREGCARPGEFLSLALMPCEAKMQRSVSPPVKTRTREGVCVLWMLTRWAGGIRRKGGSWSSPRCCETFEGWR